MSLKLTSYPVPSFARKLFPIMPNEPENPFKASSVPENHYQAMPKQEGDATGGIIPYKNPHALFAYYSGIIALLPVIGVPFGVASIVLGFMGLSRRKANPIIKGSVHAWIGIVFGFCSLLCGAVFGFGIVAAILDGSRR